MKWSRASTFLGVLLTLHATLFWLYSSGIASSHKATRSDKMFEASPDDIELLILGDSHPRSGLAPRQMGPRVVNAAVGGEHYLKTMYRVRRLLADSGKSVDTLLLPLDAGSFSGWHAENFAPEFIWGRYVDFLEIGRMRGTPWPYLTRTIKGRFFPYAGEIRTLNQIRTRRYGFGDELPNGNIAELSDLDRRGMALGQAKEHFANTELIDRGLLWAFHNMLDWADEQGIRVVLVSFPVSRDYGRFAEKSGALGRVRTEVIAPIVAEGRHTYIDHFDVFFEHDNAFADPHHLNAAGRALYSRFLAKRLAEKGILHEVPP